MKNSIDEDHGGFFNNLDRDGIVYDTTKQMWLQGRQIWNLCRLYNTLDEFKREDILKAAECGVDFVRKHGPVEGEGRIYFAVTQDGKPCKLQRKVFAEAFYIMALSEFAVTIKSKDEAKAKEVFDEANRYFENMLRFSQDMTLVGVKPLSGVEAMEPLNIPMITLNVICELRRYSKLNKSSGELLYADVADECVKQVFKHIHTDKKVMLENVGPKGEFLNSSDGRLVVPGHSIEAAWFLLQYAHDYTPKNMDLIVTQALDVIEWSINLGWDEKHGGIYYFMDILGFSPVQLEWPMKLWWVHNETMIATLLAYVITGEEKWWAYFEKVAAWSFDHFYDSDENKLFVEVAPSCQKLNKDASIQKPSGAWFGYLTREGAVNQRCIGAPYKGFFHVPRCLMMCKVMLNNLLEQNSSEQ
eukprot:m.20480 g.20480  ORF g.20480 m.20480 type:complete len:414 (-) comp5255_c0_seq1:214-1455(-)